MVGEVGAHADEEVARVARFVPTESAVRPVPIRPAMAGYSRACIMTDGHTSPGQGVRNPP
jgi:hypothetical protein